MTKIKTLILFSITSALIYSSCKKDKIEENNERLGAYTSTFSYDLEAPIMYHNGDIITDSNVIKNIIPDITSRDRFLKFDLTKPDSAAYGIVLNKTNAKVDGIPGVFDKVEYDDKIILLNPKASSIATTNTVLVNPNDKRGFELVLLSRSPKTPYTFAAVNPVTVNNSGNYSFKDSIIIEKINNDLILSWTTIITITAATLPDKTIVTAYSFFRNNPYQFNETVLNLLTPNEYIIIQKKKVKLERL